MEQKGSRLLPHETPGGGAAKEVATWEVLQRVYFERFGVMVEGMGS